MKNNVDLTSNKIFSTGGLRNIDRMIKDINGKHPWNPSLVQVYDDDSLNGYWDGDELILTGRHSDRVRKSEIYNIVEGITCDRCGIRLDIKPWNRVYGLCGECYNALQSDLNKMPYDVAESYDDLINRSNDRVIIELNYRPPRGG